MENIITKTESKPAGTSNIPAPKRSLKKRVAASVPKSRLIPSLMNYVLLRRFPFAAWVHLRRAKWMVFYSLFPKKHPGYKADMQGVSAHDKAHTIPHNAAQIGAITRYRTERLINVLRVIEGLDKKNSDLLCIGPRNEAELLLFKLYGFNLSRIKAIDLFTYSPLIEVMDMHQMSYADNSFDVLYSSFVLRYSPDIKKACQESVRVLRNNALMAVAFVTSDQAAFNIAGTPLQGGIKELLGYFGKHAGDIYWQEEHRNEEGGRTCTVIFRVLK